jgi:hypothetical protein
MQLEISAVRNMFKAEEYFYLIVLKSLYLRSLISFVHSEFHF